MRHSTFFCTLLVLVMTLTGSLPASATTIEIQKAAECTIPDLDATISKVFQVNPKQLEEKSCREATVLTSMVRDRYLGINWSVMPVASPTATAPDDDAFIAGSDKRWCVYSEVTNGGRDIKIRIRIIPQRHSCQDIPTGSLFVRHFHLNRSDTGKMRIKKVCLSAKMLTCIDGSQLSQSGQQNARWMLEHILVRIEPDETKLSYYF